MRSTSGSLGYGTLDLVDYMGGDKDIIDAARVSFHKGTDPDIDWSTLFSDDEELYHYLEEWQPKHSPAWLNNAYYKLIGRAAKLNENDAKLIGFLARHRHGSPFEHVVFKFRLRVPIKVAREWFRHRVASYNEESTRYVEMRPDFYIPAPHDVRTQVGKPGNYRFEEVDEQLAGQYILALERKHEADYQFYQDWIAKGLARELVSFELPLSLFTEFIWTVNFRALTNFLSLRNAAPAMLEIREMAAKIEEITKERVPVAYSAWVEGGRNPL